MSTVPTAKLFLCINSNHCNFSNSSTMRNIFFFISTCFLLGGCAGNHYYQPAEQQNEQVETFFYHGQPALHQRVGDAGVTAELQAQPRYYSLELFVKNVGDSEVEFDPATVQAWAYNARGEGQKLTTYSAEQFVKREKKRNLIIAGVATAVLIGTAVAVAESHSTNSQSSNNYSDNNRNNDWCFDSGFWWWGDFSSPTPTVGARGSLLRKHTIFQDESLQGVVKIGRKRGFDDKIVVKMPLNGEEVKFVFHQQTKL